jgi:hypothetical protein
LFLSDREVYEIAKNDRHVALVTKVRDAIELNLAQCFNANENLYFASESKVHETLRAFRKRRTILRGSPPSLTESPAVTPEGRNLLLLSMPAPNRRMVLPKAVEIRHAAKKGKYALGDTFIRDPVRTAVVNAELDRIQKLREEATKAAEARAGTPGS